jgi:hypothetical protein
MDGEPGHADALALELRLEGTTPLRLDRLLAGELGLSRSRLQTLDDRGLLTIEPDGAKALRKPVRDGLAARIDLAGEADCPAVGSVPLDRDGVSLNRHLDPALCWSMIFVRKPVPKVRRRGPSVRGHALKRKEGADAPSFEPLAEAYAAPITLAAFSKRLRSFGSR